MKDYSNVDKGLEIANELGLDIPQKFATRAIRNREIVKEIIPKWSKKKRKKKIKKDGKIKWITYHDTFCGQLTSEAFIKSGYDMDPILRGKNLWNVNTTMQYKNAIKSVERNELIEVNAEQAFYLACIGRPALCLSPKFMVVNGKPYNHAAITIVVWRSGYNENKGPIIAQQGDKPLWMKYISHKYAWGDNWANIMVKYFLPGLK